MITSLKFSIAKPKKFQSAKCGKLINFGFFWLISLPHQQRGTMGPNDSSVGIINRMVSFLEVDMQRL